MQKVIEISGYFRTILVKKLKDYLKVHNKFSRNPDIYDNFQYSVFFQNFTDRVFSSKFFHFFSRKSEV